MDSYIMEWGKNPNFLLTFDVEDWFQVENFKSYIPFSSWEECELRVEKNVNTILDMLDSFDFFPKATFFILGWIAKKKPDMVRRIQERGHEVASHGYSHDLPTKIPSNVLLKDLCESKKLLEDIIGHRVTGYRAPSFAADNQLLKLIHQAGYQYDTSYNSFAAHGRYGQMDLSAAKKINAFYEIFPGFFEIPITNMSFGDKVFPLGGGGYFRLMPFLLFKQAIKQVIKQQGSFVFYSHPWEIDPDQPRVLEASWQFRFRHYINLSRTQKKLLAMIETFSYCNFICCNDLILQKKQEISGA